MFAEQLWDADDIPEQELYLGKPAGSAMPLCWAHAEYISLVRSQKDGICYDRIEPVFQRYAHGGQSSKLEVWTFAHQPERINQGKTLRIICDAGGSVHWSTNNWATQQDIEMNSNSIGLHHVELPVEQCPSGTGIIFTFHWTEGDRWEEKNYVVHIA